MFEPYQSITQQIIRDIDQLPTCGWVVDLQTNGGGNFPAMLVGIGPILGEGMAGAFIDVNGHKTSWGYINGRAVIYDNGEQEYGSPLADPYSLKIQQPPAAVLTSNQTGSAAEATLISFRGRSDTQTFGQATAGVPSGVGGKVLSDGAMIALTMALEADRTGRVYAYNEKVQPDAFVHGIPRLVGTDDDPVLRAATAWLSTQSRCTETIDAVSSLNP
jgi:C-terminal processing protease CtpA/Prc